MHSYAQWTKKHNIKNKMWKKEKMILYECDTKTHTTIILCFFLFVFLLNILRASHTFSSFCSFPVLMNSSIFFAIFSPTPSLKNERRKHFCKWKRERHTETDTDSNRYCETDSHRDRHWITHGHTHTHTHTHACACMHTQTHALLCHIQYIIYIYINIQLGVEP